MLLSALQKRMARAERWKREAVEEMVAEADTERTELQVPVVFVYTDYFCHSHLPAWCKGESQEGLSEAAGF